MNRAQVEQKLASQYSKAGRYGEINKSSYWHKDLRDAFIQAGVASDREHTQDYDERRANAVQSVEDKYKANPLLRPLIGGARHKAATLASLKEAGVATDADAEKYGDAPNGGRGQAAMRLVSGRGGMGLAGMSLVAGLHGAAVGGRDMGQGIASLASGFQHGVQSAGAGFVKVGETMLNLMLSPFGKSGAAVGQLAAGLGNAFLSLTRAGGSIALAGVRIGATLIGGITGGLAGIAGGLAGAAIGSAVGLGPLLGASIGAGLAGGILRAVGGIVGTVGGAMGQMLSSIGDALGQLGSAVGSVLNSVKDVLSDLISTGKEFASATFSIQRGSGMSMDSSSGVASLSKLLTGKEGAFNSTFSGYGMMGPYQAARAQAVGVNVPANADFLSIVAAGQGRWNQLGQGGNSMETAMRRKQMLSVMAPGSEDTLGNLYSMGMGTQAVQIARKTAPTGSELKSQALTGFKLDVITRELDNLKFKLLNDLLPVIDKFAKAFGNLFNKNEGKLIAGMETFGKYLYVNLPTAIKAGGDALFGLGKTFVSLIPRIAEFGKECFHAFAALINGVRPLLAMLLDGMGIFTGNKAMRKAGMSLRNMKSVDATQWDKQFDAMMDHLGRPLGHQLDKSGFDKVWDDGFGSEKQRAAQWERMGNHGKEINVNSRIQLDVQNDPQALHKLKADVSDHVGRQAARAEARAAS